MPLPNPSMIKKWSSTIKCEPGFIKEAFISLSEEVKKSTHRRDCFLVIDAMEIRKQTLWDANQERYVGFVDYGPIPTEKTCEIATEAIVFLLVGA